jgi:transcriptional regulator with XRE-family HTH domain
LLDTIHIEVEIMSEEMNSLMQAKMELVAALESGGAPAMMAQLHRQVRHQGDLAEFAAALLATTPLPNEEALVPQYLPLAERATQRALAAVAAAPAGALTLSAVRRARGLSPAQVARQLKLGVDVLDKLEKGRIVAASVPGRLLDELAALLDISARQVRACLDVVAPATAPALRRQRTVAPRAGQETAAAQTFADAVRRSPGMSEAQREEWLAE